MPDWCQAGAGDAIDNQNYGVAREILREILGISWRDTRGSIQLFVAGWDFTGGHISTLPLIYNTPKCFALIISLELDLTRVQAVDSPPFAHPRHPCPRPFHSFIRHPQPTAKFPKVSIKRMRVDSYYIDKYCQAALLKNAHTSTVFAVD